MNHQSLRMLGFIIVLCVGFNVTMAAESCDAEAHRQFDFWIGQWEVRTSDGKVAGANLIERKQDGCVLHESYTTARGYTGESFNIYDASRKVWHQTWVDSSGTLLVLEGGIREGRMVLEGKTLGENANVIKHRITWTPNQDGTVRQLWESTDATGAWKVAFDGLYKRKS